MENLRDSFLLLLLADRHPRRMTNLLEIDDKLLRRKAPAAEMTWKLWEKKTFNIHRGVIEWQDAPSTSIGVIAERIRAGVATEFRPGWIRGFGFGVVLHLQSIPPDIAEICRNIDRRNKLRGVWQWVIIQFDGEKVALGIHTWLHGYLRPVYDTALRKLASDGYDCHSVDAAIDPLIDTLRKIGKFKGVGGIAEVLAHFV